MSPFPLRGSLRKDTLILFLTLSLVFFNGCATKIPQPPGIAFHPEKLAQMDAAIASAISSNKLPGGVLWIEHHGAAPYHRAYGQRSVDPVEAMTEDTIFDAASRTSRLAITMSGSETTGIVSLETTTIISFPYGR